MNLNGNASVYNRRRAYISRACSGYLRMNIGSRDNIDCDVDDGNSDAGSIQSTTSTRSYRSWKKAQKKRHLAAKFSTTRSLFGENTEGVSQIEDNRITNGSDVDQLHSYHSGSTFPSEEEPPVPILSTIVQSPLDPYYSSSSLESLSSDSDVSVKSSSLFHPQSDNTNKFMTSQSHENTRTWLMSGSYQHNGDVIEKRVTSSKPDEAAPTVTNKTFKELKSPINGLNEISEIESTENEVTSPPLTSYRMTSSSEVARDEDADTLVNNNYVINDVTSDKLQSAMVDHTIGFDLANDVTSSLPPSPLEVAFDHSIKNDVSITDISNDDVTKNDSDVKNDKNDILPNDVNKIDNSHNDVIKNVVNDNDVTVSDYTHEDDSVGNSDVIIKENIESLKKNGDDIEPSLNDVTKKQITLIVNTKDDVTEKDEVLESLNTDDVTPKDEVSESLNSDDVICQSTKSSLVEDFPTPPRRDSAEELAEIIVNKGSRDANKKSRDTNGGSRGHVGNGYSNHGNGLVDTNQSTPRHRTRLPMIASSEHQSLCCCIIL